jgi:hypothetical protein
MLKYLLAALVATVGIAIGVNFAYAQSPTPSPSPSPTPTASPMVTPEGAPTTGFGTL